MQTDYEPWFTPVLETVIGGEIPGEAESYVYLFIIYAFLFILAALKNPA